MRVLFVVKEYLPKPTPPGLCIMNVQHSLYHLGVKSDVIMVGDREGLFMSNEIGDVYSIQSDISFEIKKQGILHFLKVHIPMIFTWPVPSIKRVKDYRRVIGQLDSERHYDAIIGTMFPPDVCVSCSKYNHFFYYELDSLINNPMYKTGVKKYLKRRLERLEKKLFDRAELIIHLNNNRKFYNKDKYLDYNQKSVFTDIPYLLEKKKNPDEEGLETRPNGDKLLMVYSGHLSKNYRPPFKLIELIKQLSKNVSVTCLFFSRGDCEDVLRQAELETNGVVKRMGYVSREELAIYTKQADFLLDIGNHLSGEDYSLPSKVIDYMSMGKPIIHMNGVNDFAIEYLKKYGLALNVPNDFSEKYVVDILVPFINKTRGIIQPFSETARRFPQNTPEYTANLIMQQIKKHYC